MTTLYSKLSEVYDEMYRGLIDYENEYLFYSQILSKFNCQSVLEIGCGSGNLAGLFSLNGYDYSGLDLSMDMLSIARKRYPACKFLPGDMTEFNLPDPVDAAIITGRTISYLVNKNEVYKTCNTIHSNLKDDGIICFDFIDANKFIPLIRKGEKVTHSSCINNRQLQRDSFWSVNLNYSWAFNWHSIFYEKSEDGSLRKIGEDNSTISAFTKDDMILFMQLTGFEILEIIPRPSYAFDTFVMVARKIK